MDKIQSTLTESQLATYVANQLNAAYPDDRKVLSDTLRAILPTIMRRLTHCFSHINNKYFFAGNKILFNHLHGDQYAMFLYLAANTAYRQGVGDGLPEKLFLLNKMLYGIDAFHEVELPSVFLFVHPLGTVLGRGSYSDYLLVYQRCGIGSNHDVYPKLDKFVTLRPGASILGNSHVGRNSTIGAESLLLDRDLSENSLYIGNPRDFIIRSMPTNEPLNIWRDTNCI